MANKKISAATLITTPAITDMYPAAQSGSSTAFHTTLAQVAGLSGHCYLGANTLVGATSITLKSLPTGAGSALGWVVIDPYTTDCEIRLASTISGLSVAVSALAYAHSSNDVVLFIPSPVYHLAWFGAGPGIAAATNSTAIQRAINAAAGSGWVIAGAGTYSYDTDLEIPDGGLYLAGVGASEDSTTSTTLSYTGSGTAIKQAAGFTNGSNKIILRDFRLVGTANALNGIDTTGASKYGLLIENLFITSFSKSGAYGLILDDVYAGVLRNVLVQTDNDSCIKTTGTGDITLINCWLSHPVNYGLHITSTSGEIIMIGGYIDAAVNPVTQIGIYQTSASRTLLYGVHFEDLYQQLNITAGTINAHDCYFGTETVAWTISEGVKARFYDNFHVIAQNPTYGLGTVWNGNVGRITPPTITDATSKDDLSTVMQMTATTPTTFAGFQGNGINEFEGVAMMVFNDANYTVSHDGAQPGAIILRDGFPVKFAAGEALILMKSLYNAGDTDTELIEIGRYRKQASRFEHLTGDRTITTADHGMTFDNIDGPAVATITLPAVNAASLGLTVTFVKTHNSNAIHIDPAGNDRIKCVTLGGVGKKLYLAGTGAFISVTLQNVMGALGTFWEVIAGSNEAACTFEA